MSNLFNIVVSAAVLSASATAAAAQNLVENPGFETGDFTGWAAYGNDLNNGVDDFNPNSGTYAAFFGEPVSTGGIRQTLGTLAGQSYVFSFFLGNNLAGNNSFRVFWGGIQLASLTNAAAFDYTEYVFPVVATGDATEIHFEFRHTLDYWDLDDVSVVAAQTVVPEPMTMLLFGTGLAGIAAVRRRRRTAHDVTT